MADRTPTDRTEVELPQDVVDRIEARLPGTKFDSVEAYAASALDLLLREVASADRDGAAGPPTAAAADTAAGEDGATTDGGTSAAETGAAETGASDATAGDEELSAQSADGPGTNQVTDAPDRDAVEEQLESLGYL